MQLNRKINSDSVKIGLMEMRIDELREALDSSIRFACSMCGSWDCKNGCTHSFGSCASVHNWKSLLEKIEYDFKENRNHNENNI